MNLATVAEQMENLIDIAALINAKTSVQEALMTEIRAGDQFFNNNTDSALVKEKSAWEMAGGVKKGVWVPSLGEVFNFVGS